jgi:hypothetical protein
MVPERLLGSEAVGLVRVVNTAEAEFRLKNQSFAALEDLLSRCSPKASTSVRCRLTKTPLG